MDYQWPEGTPEQEEEGFQVGRQWGLEESAAWTLRDAEDMQRQLQEKAGGQTPTEQCEGCVGGNEAHHGDEGERQADIWEPG